MTIQSQNNNLNDLTDPTMLIDRLFCHFKELLEKIIEQKIVQGLFHILCTNVLMS